MYQAFVEAAAERAAVTGAVDLVDLANAASAGFDVSTFQADVMDEAERLNNQ